jgi:hypothetical protein
VPVVVTIVVILALLIALIHHERRTEHPLVHPALLGNRLVAGANVATLGASIGMVGLLYFFNLFAQSAVGFDSNAMGVIAALVPFGVSLIVCAQFARWLRIRVGPRWPAVLGLGLMTVGFGLLATTTGATSKTQLVVPLVITGLGAGVANASLTGVAVLDLPAGRVNEAAGWISLSRFLGSALAIAVGTTTYLSIGGPEPPVGTGVSGGTTFDVAVERLDHDLFAPLITATQDASAERFARTMLLTAVVLGIITVVSWWLLGTRRSERV